MTVAGRDIRLGPEIDVGLPFNWKCFYFAALAFALGSLIIQLRCPPLLKALSTGQDGPLSPKAPKSLIGAFVRLVLKDRLLPPGRFLPRIYTDFVKLTDYPKPDWFFCRRTPPQRTDPPDWADPSELLDRCDSDGNEITKRCDILMERSIPEGQMQDAVNFLASELSVVRVFSRFFATMLFGLGMILVAAVLLMNLLYVLRMT